MAFERWICGPGEYSKEIRKIVAHIATQLPPDCPNILHAVLKIIIQSFRTMNATIRQNGFRQGPARHLLLNVGTGGKTPTVAKKQAVSLGSSAEVICLS
jgi:hypothetical protein